jgi:hypothetical protein
VAITLDDVLALEQLDSRLRLLLPEQYQDTYEDVTPVSMGSAGLKYDIDGKVAWNDMWATFCDLAMAGGPPHRGSLLEPAPLSADEVAREICRGIQLVTRLSTQPSSQLGWVEVQCQNETMAAWLVRAIVMENVLARHEGRILFLPAGPEYRLHKEIKNVITAVAKTCHYWMEHIPPEQQQFMESALVNLPPGSQLLGPCQVPGQDDLAGYEAVLASVAQGIRTRTARPCFTHRYVGWLGVECQSVRAAIWMMRAIVVSNVLARRENVALFIPVNPVVDPGGERVVNAFAQAHHLASVRKIV